MTMTEKANQVVVLLVMDGWGVAANSTGNPIEIAKKPNYDALLAEYPNALLEASGEAVGLPSGEDGNSEVGHINIGAGRIVMESLPRINLSIVDGSFFSNEAFATAINKAGQEGGRLHLMGLIGSGGVHAYNDHLYALLQLAKKRGVKSLFLHLFTDGRDSPPTESKIHIRKLETELKRLGIGKVATIVGRYYAMDRDLRWERTEKAYVALTEPIANRAKTGVEALETSYQHQLSDEFVEPVQIGDDVEESRIRDGDAVIFYNFRIDRPRQLTKALVLEKFEETAMNIKGFDPYETEFHKKHLIPTPENTPFKRNVVLKDLTVATMTEYEPDLPVEIAFPPIVVPRTLGEVVADAGIRQLRLAETEKERFVTFYFNGGVNRVFKGEDRLMLPSPKVETYDQEPEMATAEIAYELINKLDSGQYGFFVVNFASPDMVAHTGDLVATKRAIESVDEAIGRIVAKVKAINGVLIITADHGNAEELLNGNGHKNHVDTEHSTNPVPFILVSDKLREVKLNNGVLADVAPTVLKIMGLPKPVEMTSEALF